ncbi:MAG: hypothetical protein SGILL_007819, partial [Bacillariaceae sp.]
REYGNDTRVVSALMRSSAQAMADNGIGTIWTGRDNGGYLCENSLRLITTRWEPSYRKGNDPGVSSTKVGLGALKYVDERAREREPKVGKREKFRGLFIDEEDMLAAEEMQADLQPASSVKSIEEGDLFSDDDDDDDEHDDYIKSEAGQVQNLGDENSLDATRIDFDEKDEQNAMDEAEIFEMFLQELKEEAARNGEIFDLNVEDARELFDAMQEEFMSELEEGGDIASGEFTQTLLESSLASEGPFDATAGTFESSQKDSLDNVSNAEVLASSNEPTLAVPPIHQDPERLSKIESLQEALPGLPLSRINKVVDAFDKTLGYPSMLALVPILRETMPDYVTSRWLKRVNNSNAEFALRKASEDNAVDISLLNSMLQVKANYGFIQGALDFHTDQYRKHGL